MCLLLGFRSYDKWTFYKQRMVVFFSLPKGRATAFIQGNQATLLSDLDSASSAYKFYLEPLFMHNQIKRIVFINKHERYQNKQLKINHHQIYFSGKHILMADSCFNGKQLKTHKKGGILLLSENSKVDIHALLSDFPPTILLLDGTNSVYFTTKLQVAAKNYAVPSYNLKKLKAYLVNIKE